MSGHQFVGINDVKLIEAGAFQNHRATLLLTTDCGGTIEITDAHTTDAMRAMAAAWRRATMTPPLDEVRTMAAHHGYRLVPDEDAASMATMGRVMEAMRDSAQASVSDVVHGNAREPASPFEYVMFGGRR